MLICTLLLQTISCQVFNYVLQQVQTLTCCSSLNNKYFCLQLPEFTCYFHCSIISYHFIYSLLMTHFTSHYYYTLKIAWVNCIFAYSDSPSYLFSLTIPVITNAGGSNGVNTGPMKHWLPFLNNTNPI